METKNMIYLVSEYASQGEIFGKCFSIYIHIHLHTASCVCLSHFRRPLETLTLLWRHSVRDVGGTRGMPCTKPRTTLVTASLDPSRRSRLLPLLPFVLREDPLKCHTKTVLSRDVASLNKFHPAFLYVYSQGLVGSNKSWKRNHVFIRCYCREIRWWQKKKLESNPTIPSFYFYFPFYIVDSFDWMNAFRRSFYKFI